MINLKKFPKLLQINDINDNIHCIRQDLRGRFVELAQREINKFVQHYKIYKNVRKAI